MVWARYFYDNPRTNFLVYFIFKTYYYNIENNINSLGVLSSLYTDEIFQTVLDCCKRNVIFTTIFLVEAIRFPTENPICICLSIFITFRPVPAGEFRWI